MKHRRSHPSGFTLIEMVLVISLVALLSPLVFAIFLPIINSWALESQTTEATTAATEALVRITNEMAQLRDNLSVTTASASVFQFTDVNGNSLQYSLSAGNLMRNNDILARGIQSLSFSYWDVNGAALANPLVTPSITNLWRVSVDFVCQRGGQSVRMASQIHPRNLPRL